MGILVGLVLLVLLGRVVYVLVTTKDWKQAAEPVVLGLLAVVVGYVVSFDYHWWVALALAVVGLYLAWARKSVLALAG